MRKRILQRAALSILFLIYLTGCIHEIEYVYTSAYTYVNQTSWPITIEGIDSSGEVAFDIIVIQPTEEYTMKLNNDTFLPPFFSAEIVKIESNGNSIEYRSPDGIFDEKEYEFLSEEGRTRTYRFIFAPDFFK